MRMFLFVLGLASVSGNLFAQSPLRNAVPTITYHVVSEEGTNACAVAYCPKNGFYYTAFAGNAAYPLETFDANGKNVHTGETGIDLRSLWYNAKSHLLQGLAYPRRGKFSIGLNEAGKPATLKEPTDRVIASIPNDQSTAFNAGKAGLLVFDGKTVYVLNPSSLKQKKVITPRNIPGDMGDLNNTSVIYTGVKGYELGFYDSFEAKMYYTDMKGNYTGTTLLPGDAPNATSFRCSFANHLLWLYNATERTWFAYRIF